MLAGHGLISNINTVTSIITIHITTVIIATTCRITYWCLRGVGEWVLVIGSGFRVEVCSSGFRV